MYIEFSTKVVCVTRRTKKKIYTFEKPGLLLLAKSFQPSCPETLSEKMPGLKKRLEKISGMIPNFLNLMFPGGMSRGAGKPRKMEALPSDCITLLLYQLFPYFLPLSYFYIKR